MRTPTPATTLYRWHRLALAGRKPAITHEPQCGWFKRRLVRGGPWVPARIWVEQEIDASTGELLADEVMRCEVDRRARDAAEEWTYLAGHPIPEPEFQYLLAEADWCRQHAPSAPAANPQQKVLSRTIPPLF